MTISAPNSPGGVSKPNDKGLLETAKFFAETILAGDEELVKEENMLLKNTAILCYLPVFLLGFRLPLKERRFLPVPFGRIVKLQKAE